jgi:hypothetical protein
MIRSRFESEDVAVKEDGLWPREFPQESRRSRTRAGWPRQRVLFCAPLSRAGVRVGSCKSADVDRVAIVLVCLYIAKCIVLKV